MAITLNSKVYNFAGYDTNAVSDYQETTTGIPTAASDLTNRVQQGNGKVVRVKWRLIVPIVATEGSECSCAGDVLRTTHVNIEYTLPTTSTLAERQDVRLRIASLVANAQYIASIDNLVQATG
jgi:hypothetical protein